MCCPGVVCESWICQISCDFFLQHRRQWGCACKSLFLLLLHRARACVYINPLSHFTHLLFLFELRHLKGVFISHTIILHRPTLKLHQLCFVWIIYINVLILFFCVSMSKLYWFILKWQKKKMPKKTKQKKTIKFC